MDLLSESSKVNKLYSYYGLLADCEGSEVSQKEDIYKQIVMAAHGCSKEKRLASQFIPVFFKHFPNIADMAIDAQLDLCEDVDAVIRRQAIKELPLLCRDCPSQTKKIAMILAQLLSIKDPTEQRIVHKALTSLFQINAKDSIIGIFNQIKSDDDFLRNSCLRFLSLKANDITKDLKTAGGEEQLLNEINSVLLECTLEEIPLLMKIALSSDSCSSLEGKNKLAVIFLEQMKTFLPFDTTNNEVIERIIIFLRYARLLHSGDKAVCVNRFVLYICTEILPHLKFISNYEESTGYALELLQLLAEISSYVNELKDEVAVKSVLKVLWELIPENGKECESVIHFSYIECLLYTLHKLIKFNLNVFTIDPGLLKDFRLKLQQLACIVQGNLFALETHLNTFFSDIPGGPHNLSPRRRWFQAVKYATENNCNDSVLTVIESREILKLKNPCESNTLNGSDMLEHYHPQDYDKIKRMSEIQQNCLRAMAFDTFTNILTLIKDFFREPPSFELSVQLSFLPSGKEIKETSTNNVTDISDNTSEQAHEHESASSRPYHRPKLALYIPPSGRYSATFRRSN